MLPEAVPVARRTEPESMLIVSVEARSSSGMVGAEAASFSMMMAVAVTVTAVPVAVAVRVPPSSRLPMPKSVNCVASSVR